STGKGPSNSPMRKAPIPGWLQESGLSKLTPIHLQLFSDFCSMVMASRISGGRAQQTSDITSEPAPVTLIMASSAQRVDVGALTAVGTGTIAPPSTICGNIRIITIKG